MILKQKQTKKFLVSLIALDNPIKDVYEIAVFKKLEDGFPDLVNPVILKKIGWHKKNNFPDMKGKDVALKFFIRQCIKFTGK